MKTLAVALAGSLIATAVWAQSPPTPPSGGSETPSSPPSAGAPRGDMGRGDMGRGDMMRGEMGRRMMMHHSRGARFVFRRGETRIGVKCADDEPTRVCVDATLQLLDKITAFR